MADKAETKKILTSKEEIMDYAGLSKYTYAKFLKRGMPVLYFDGRCYAHKDNIDDFFKAITRVNSSNSPDAKIEGDIETNS